MDPDSPAQPIAAEPGSALAESLLAVIAGESSWNRTLGVLADAIGADGVALAVSERASGTLLGLHHSGLPRARVDALERELRRSASQTDSKTGVASATGRDHVIGLDEVEDGAIGIALRAYRARDQGAFGADAEAILRRAMPHVRRAMGVARRIDDNRAVVATLDAALARLPVGIALVTVNGRPVYASAALRAIASRDDGIQLSADRLSFGGAGNRSDATRALNDAIETGTLPVTGLTLAVQRASGRRPYAVALRPIALAVPGMRVDPAAMLVRVVDPERPAVPSGATLQALFHLTAREVQLARALAAGRTLAETATRLGIEEITARGYLSQVMRKTGTARQPALLALMLAVGVLG